MLQDAPSSQTSQRTQATTNIYQKYNLGADIRTVAAYIVQSKASQLVQEAFEQIRDTSTCVKGSTTEQAIHQLQDVVQKLSTQVEKNTLRPGTGVAQTLYTAAAGQAAQQSCVQQSRTDAILTKPVPVQHKHEIIAIQDKETTVQKTCSYKEMAEQLNNIGIAGRAAAVCQLPSRDLIITIEDKQACGSQLTDTKQLSALGTGVQVKYREFAVIVYRIRVNQVQGQTQVIEVIYQQNPKLKGTVDILYIAFTKKLLQAGRLTGLLIISIAEPEQANCLINTGLIQQYKLYNCELYKGSCKLHSALSTTSTTIQQSTAGIPDTADFVQLQSIQPTNA